MASEAELERLIVKIMGDNASYIKSLKQSSKATTNFVQKTGAKIKKVGAAFSSMGRKMAVGLTAPIVGLGGFAVKAFADFDQAMTESTSIMGDQVIPHIAAMRKQALSLASAGPQGPAELAKSYFFLASAGLNAEQAIAALPAVQNFATAGAFDMALATDLLTDAQTALGMASSDAEVNLANMIKISDVFVKANTSANTSVQQISEALTSDAGTASRNFGQSLETTVAVLDAYASAGKKGAEAGNLFGRATRLLSKAQRDNGAVFKKFGIKVIDEATGEYASMIDIIADMEVAFKDLTKPQRDAALEQLGFAALAQKSITPLLGLSGAMKGYKKELDAAAGATKEVSEKQMKSFTNQMEVMWNQIKVVAIGIGETLAPMLLVLNTHLQNGLKWWDGLSKGAQGTILVIVGVVAAIGPLLLIMGGLIAAGGVIISVLGTMLGAFLALFSPIGIIIAGIVAIIAIVIQLTDLNLGEMWESGLAAAKNFIATVFGFIHNLPENWKLLTTFMQNNWLNMLTDMTSMIGFFIVNMAANFGVAMETIANSFMKLGEIAWQALKDAITGKKGQATSLGEALMEELTKGMANLKDPLDGFKPKTEKLPKFNFEFDKKIDDAALVDPLAAGTKKGIDKAKDLAAVGGKAIGTALGAGIKGGLTATEAGSAEALSKLMDIASAFVPALSNAKAPNKIPLGMAPPKVVGAPKQVGAPKIVGGGGPKVNQGGANNRQNFLERIAIAVEVLVEIEETREVGDFIDDAGLI